MNRFILILVVSMLAAGCGTLITRSGLSRLDNPEQTPRYYPATCLDGNAIGSRYFVLGLLDLPFSLVFDTLFLPYDLIVDPAKRTALVPDDRFLNSEPKTQSNQPPEGMR